MNIAYLDPPYSNYFEKLAARLRERTEGSTIALLSCPSYRMYTGNDRLAVWEPGHTDRRHAVPAALRKASWARAAPAQARPQPASTTAPSASRREAAERGVRKPLSPVAGPQPSIAADKEAFERTFSHAVEWFKQRFVEEQIALCLVFSDARPFSMAAHVAARELGVVCLYFERGAFRSRTASLSARGLNARFSLARAQQQPAADSVVAHQLEEPRPVEPWLKLRFVRFLLANGLACAFDARRRLMQHKRYHPFNYARIALWQFVAEHPALQRKLEPEQPGSRPIVLVPLQLQTDSQFVMHSPFHHNQAFIDFVVPRICKVMPEADVVLKRHPMDVRSYRLPPGSRMIRGSLAPWLPRAALMVCINSTAGFEAAVRGKPVLCFADSFYTDQPPVVRVRVADFERKLADARGRRTDLAAGKALRSAVLRCYQAPGDVWAYSDHDLGVAADVVLRHFTAEVRRRRNAGEPVVPVNQARRFDATVGSATAA